MYFSDLFQEKAKFLAFRRKYHNKNIANFMAKETIVKENPVTDALRKLKEEELELMAKLKPLQEAIGALEKILDKSSKKAKPAKESVNEAPVAEEAAEEVEELEKAE
jgi:hypothetical protein